MGNQAVYVNPPVLNGIPAAIHLTSHGSSWLWALFSLFALFTLLLTTHSFLTPSPRRFFHTLLLPALAIATISTFTLASDLGFAPVAVEFVRTHHTVAGATRQVFYVRYIDWFLTTPLLLGALLAAAALPAPVIAVTLFFADAAVISGLVGALVPSDYKWGYFVLALASAAYVLYTIFGPGRISAAARGSDVARAYGIGAVFVPVLVVLYAICWGVSEGGNVIAPDSEAVFYGILDLIAKVGFGGALLWSVRDVHPGRLGVGMRGFEDEVPGAREAEKKNGV